MAKAAKKVPVKYYRLGRDYFNGKVKCPRGSIQPFPEGGQPQTATEVSSEDMRAEAQVSEDATLTVLKADMRAWLAEELPDMLAELMEVRSEKEAPVAVAASVAKT